LEENGFSADLTDSLAKAEVPDITYNDPEIAEHQQTVFTTSPDNPEPRSIFGDPSSGAIEDKQIYLSDSEMQGGDVEEKTMTQVVRSREQNEFFEAKKSERQAVDEQEELLVRDQEYTLLNESSAAVELRDKGMYDKVEMMAGEPDHGAERNFGPDNETTLLNSIDLYSNPIRTSSSVFMENRKLSPNLKKELEEEMTRNAAQNDLAVRGRFVSDEFVAELLQEKNLEAHLRSDYNQWAWPVPLPQKYRRLSKAIRTDGQIVYCILVLIDRQKDIQALLYEEPAVNDRTLFERDHTGHRRSCSREELRRIPQFDDTAAEEFYQKQWNFPPTLYTTGGTPKFDLQHFKMPFDQKCKYVASGTFGSVYKTEIRKEFLRSREESSSVSVVFYRGLTRVSG
jgi:hypothetical protein